MGLIASGGPASPPSKSTSSAVRNIRLSPLKGSAAVARQQPVVVGGGGMPVAAALQQAGGGGGTQQVIRIPASSLQHVMGQAAAGQVQQIQVGNKMQYMRVVQAGAGTGTQAAAAQAQQQVLHLRGATPILPSTAAPVSKARAKSTLSGVKISVPPGGLAKGANVTLAGNYKVYQNRVLLPQGETLVKQEVRNEPVRYAHRSDRKFYFFQPSELKSVISATTANEMNSAYEAFLNRPKDHGRGSRDDHSAGAAGDGDAASVGAASDSNAPFEPSGVRPRKPCNCTKSQCLKLYCDCFANGEFCFNCNCNNCFNNLQHEEERQKAIKQCLDRNPNAFKPKVR